MTPLSHIWQSGMKAKRRFATSNEITDSEPVNGDDLLGSEELKRQLREAKERLKSESDKSV